MLAISSKVLSFGMGVAGTTVTGNDRGQMESGVKEELLEIEIL